MYKGRIWVWSLVLVIAIVISNFSGIKGEYFKPAEKVKVYVDNADSVFAENILNDEKIRGIKFIYTDKENADIIIQKESNEEISGFEKYDNIFYSPFVLTSFDTNCGFFAKTIKEEYPKIDFKDYLERMEKGELATNYYFEKESRNIDEELALCIPDKNNAYYEDIRKFFLITLYNTPTTEENKDERFARIDKILSKCTQISLSEFYERRLYPYSLYLTTEAIGYDDPKIYPQKSYSVSYDIYLKKDNKEFNEKFLDIIKNNKKAFEKSYFRIKNCTFKCKSYNRSYWAEIFPYVKNDEMFQY